MTRLRRKTPTEGQTLRRFWGALLSISLGLSLISSGCASPKVEPSENPGAPVSLQRKEQLDSATAAAQAIRGIYLAELLKEKRLFEWKEDLVPTAEEASWLEIPWLSTFADGIRAADRQEKPLLLWVMNGHPLGCT